jgi:hypothetical protein
MEKGMESWMAWSAKGLLEGHPHLEWDGTCEIEVHEVMPLPG